MSRDPDPQTGFVEFRYSRTKVIRINLGLGRTDVQVPPAPPRPKFWGRIALDERNGVSVSVEFVDVRPTTATRAATAKKRTQPARPTKRIR